jgi:sigma-B regulation protein RsbU (phosphoserine phosphatase)
MSDVGITGSMTSGLFNAAPRQQLLDRRRRLETAAAEGAPSHISVLLNEVDAALERLGEGSFGLCDECHVPIEADRLAADPLVRVCVECLTPDQRRALEYDLELAAHIQGALLPATGTGFPGWEIHYEYRPLGTVSGDYCELIQCGENGDRLFFALGDVSGKGVSAAILMAHMQAIFRSLVALDTPLGEMMERANHLFCGSTLASSYSTLVCGTVTRQGRLEVCNAGHCPPLLYGEGRVCSIPATGVPLGMFAYSEFEVRSFDVNEGDRMLLYTDGLMETVNELGQEFGIKPLESIVASNGDLSAAETAAGCLEGLDAFRNGSPIGDDLTVMVMRYAG